MQLFDNPRKFKNILRELSQNFSLETNEIIETLERALVSAYKRFDPYNDNIQASINPDTGILTIMDLTGKNEIDLTPFVRIAEATVNQVINQKLPLEQIARMHNLDMDVINTTLESALTSAYMKMSKPVNFSLDSREQSNKNKQQPDVEVKIDPDTGGVIIQELRTVVDEIKNPDKEITLADAVKIKGSRNVNIGDVIKLSRNPENLYIDRNEKCWVCIDCSNADWLYSISVVGKNEYFEIVEKVLLKWDTISRKEYNQKIHTSLVDSFKINERTLLESMRDKYGIDMSFLDYYDEKDNQVNFSS